jgi:hypothetical protein
VVVRGGLGVVCSVAAVLLATPAIAQESADELRDTVDDSAPDDLGAPPPAVLIPPPPAFEPEPVRRIPRRSVAEQDEKLGIGMGPFKTFATLETGVVASTNPGKSSSNRKAGVALRAAPSLRLQSDWSRHDLRVEASGEIIEYLDQSSASTRSALLQSNFRLDIRSTTFAEFDASYDLNQERDVRRGTGALTADPRLDQTLAAGAAITHDFGNLASRVGFRFSRFIADDVRLSDGTTENNSDRDYLAPELTLRLALRPQSPLSPFIEAAVDHRSFDRARNRFGLKSDSLGLRTSVGLAFNDSPIWEGALAATYLWRDFADASLKSESTFGVTGAVTWRPTDFATFTFTSGVGLDDSRDSAEPTSRTWTAGLNSTYSLTDAISINGNAAVEITDGAGPADLTTDIGIGVEWQANTYVAFALRGENTWFDTRGSADDYTEQRLIASLILQR